MPPLAETLERAQFICKSHTLNGQLLYKLISIDPILFCQTQILFNYFYPKLTGTFNSISKIIILLNINTVKNHILQFIVKTKAEQQKQLFLHSIAVGIASRFIAKERNIDRKKFELYYAAGLLHDIGKYFSCELDHCITGEIAAKTIGLHKSLRNVVAYHHNIQEYNEHDSDLLFNVVLADYFVHKYIHTAGTEKYCVEIDDSIWKTLNLKKDFFASVDKDIRAEIKKIEKFIRAGIY